MGQSQPLPQSGIRGGGINPHDAFVNVNSALEMAVRSRKPKAVALVKWLTKKVLKSYKKITRKPLRSEIIESKPSSMKT